MMIILRYKVLFSELPLPAKTNNVIDVWVCSVEFEFFLIPLHQTIEIQRTDSRNQQLFNYEFRLQRETILNIIKESIQGRTNEDGIVINTCIHNERKIQNRSFEVSRKIQIQRSCKVVVPKVDVLIFNSIESDLETIFHGILTNANGLAYRQYSAVDDKKTTLIIYLHTLKLCTLITLRFSTHTIN